MSSRSRAWYTPRMAKKRKVTPPPFLSPHPPPEAEVEKALALKYFTSEELAHLQSGPKSVELSMDEKIAILEMYSAGLQPTIIATRLSRAVSTVKKFITKHRSRIPLARAIIESQADVLAERVIKHSTVEEAMEILDRVDVLPKKDKNSGQSNSQFNLIIGMPGGSTVGSMASQGPPAIPVPSQKQIEAARK